MVWENSAGSSRGNTGARGVSTQPARTIKDGVESRAPANPLFLRDEELRQAIELMFYGIECNQLGTKIIHSVIFRMMRTQFFKVVIKLINQFFSGNRIILHCFL